MNVEKVRVHDRVKGSARDLQLCGLSLLASILLHCDCWALLLSLELVPA